MVNKGDMIHSDWAIHPGEYLADTLEALGISQAELAHRCGRPAQAINEIVRGKKSITPETAIALESVLGIAAHIWLGLESEYQLAVARERSKEQLQSETELLSDFPVSKMETLGWIPKSSRLDRTAKVSALLEYFGVASLGIVLEQPVYAGAALRVSAGAKVKNGALAAWLRQGYLRGNQAETDAFDKDRFMAVLQSARGCTRENVADAISKVTEELARAGVALVLVPELPGTGANGCTRWLGEDKALIQLNLRNRWADIFWFSFFHEAGHVIQERRKTVFVDLESRTDDSAELEADRFAADTLIPPNLWREILDSGSTSKGDIEDFAKRIGIHPGIVVGRMQREVWQRYDRHNALRVRYNWSGES